MLKKIIEFKDYNGESHKFVARFHLTQSEIIKMNFTTGGALTGRVKRIVDAKLVGEMVEVLDDLIKLSYGKQSDDGLRFVKSKENYEEFVSSPAYDKFFMELLSDADELAAFINGLLPTEIVNIMDKIPEDKMNEIIDNPKLIENYVQSNTKPKK